MAEPFVAQDDEIVDTLSDLFDVLETSIKGSIHTGLVAVVTSYDTDTQTCSAQPVAKARFDNGDRFQIPVIPRIPVMFPSGGGFAITWPLEAGDFVFLSFSERSIDEWKAAATQSTTPSDLRRFDLSDAVAHPGVASPRSPRLSAVEDTMVIGEDNPLGLQIKIKDGTITIGTPLVEILNQLSTLIGYIANAETVTALGPSPLLTKVNGIPPPVPIKPLADAMQVLIDSITGD